MPSMSATACARRACRSDLGLLPPKNYHRDPEDTERTEGKVSLKRRHSGESRNPPINRRVDGWMDPGFRRDDDLVRLSGARLGLPWMHLTPHLLYSVLSVSSVPLW